MIQALRSRSNDLSEFRLSEERVERLRSLLPDKERGVARVDDRRDRVGVINLCRLAGAGSILRLLRPRKTFYNPFVRSAANGVLQELLIARVAAGGHLRRP